MSGAKSWDLKLRTYALWTPHKEHTESAIRKDNLAPCRFKCWTNQISIGISQPLAQLQRRYNVEIPRVSLQVGGLKWDFRTDIHRHCHCYDILTSMTILWPYYHTIMTTSQHFYHYIITILSHYYDRIITIMTGYMHPVSQPVPKAYRKCCVKCKMKCSNLKSTLKML